MNLVAAVFVSAAIVAKSGSPRQRYLRHLGQ